jgi:hypothetical protein
MKKDILTRPFAAEQVKQRPGQHGKTLSYVDIAAVIDRLNEAFEHRWDFEVVRHEVHETEVVVLGKLTADAVTKMAFGGSAITMDSQGMLVSVGDDLKAASSDALKKSASLLGIALELYGGAPSAAQEDNRLRQGPSPGQHVRQHVHNAPVAERLTSRQLAAIHGASRRQGLSREELGSFIQKRTGKPRPEQLTRAEASEVITSLSGSFNGNGSHS